MFSAVELDVFDFRHIARRHLDVFPTRLFY
jgi:hypothetical protein